MLWIKKYLARVVQLETNRNYFLIASNTLDENGEFYTSSG